MKVILYMAITANGMIAKENDDTPWSQEEWESYARKVKECGNLIIGRKTFEVTDKNDFKKIGNPFVVVVSSKKLSISKGAVFENSPEQALTLVKEKGFSQALICGGGGNNTSFMKAGLVNEIYLDVEPFIFGKGIPLFRPEEFEYKLELLEVNKLSSQTIQLHYKVLK